MGREVGEAWESEMVVGERVALRRMRGWRFRCWVRVETFLRRFWAAPSRHLRLRLLIHLDIPVLVTRVHQQSFQGQVARS